MRIKQVHRNQILTNSKTITGSSRLTSLDALRGFDMMWIISGEMIFNSLAKATNIPFFKWMSGQLHHTPWNGFTFYDMIFPLFIFIAGVSMPYSIGKKLEKSSSEDSKSIKRRIYISLIRRTLVLIFCGMVVNGLLQWKGYENTRFASVLGRIAISCFFAAIIYLNFNLRYQLLWFGGLLLGYWALMSWVPVPGYGAGVLTPEGNLAGYIDRLLLPGKLHRKIYDPEGLLSTLPAIGTALLGVFTGHFFRWQSTKWTKLRKSVVLAAAGLLLLTMGLIWDRIFPINKNLWTSSFVIYTGGWSLLLLFFFYLIIDVLGYKKWSMPFVWIGMNSILIYMASHGLVNFAYTASSVFGGLIQFAPPEWQPVWLATSILLIQLTLLYLLYRKKLFLKV
jgi:predicted acyltransferase